MPFMAGRRNKVLQHARAVLHAALFLFATTSLVLGTIMAIVFSRRPLEPLRKI